MSYHNICFVSKTIGYCKVFKYVYAKIRFLFRFFRYRFNNLITNVNYIGGARVFKVFDMY